MNNIKKTVQSILVLLFLLTSTGLASAQNNSPVCTGGWYQVLVIDAWYCTLWTPGLIPGGGWSTAAPSAQQVNIISNPNYTGTSETFNTNMYCNDTSVWGWNNTTTTPSIQTLKISSIATGSDASFLAYPGANYTGTPVILNGYIADTTSYTIASFKVIIRPLGRTVPKK